MIFSIIFAALSGALFTIAAMTTSNDIMGFSLFLGVVCMIVSGGVYESHK